MPSQFTPRSRKVRILATLGPASSSREMIAKLMAAGADAFRINMSHGGHDDKSAIIATIRELEKAQKRPTTILVDLQGPKLRVGDFADGKVGLRGGDRFAFDRDPSLGDATRVELPHPELFRVAEAGTRLLLDDGKLVLRVTKADQDRLETEVVVGGALSNHKGQCPRCRRPDPRAHAKGPRRSRFRARTRRGLDRAVLRAAA